MIRKLNRCLNKLLFPYLHRWIFIYKSNIRTWKPVTKTLDSSLYLLSSKWDYPHAVKPNCEDIISLMEWLDSFSTQSRATITEFVRSIPYTADESRHDGLDWAKTPSQTLYSGKADCEDLAILYVSLMRRAGQDAHLVWLRRPEGYKGLNHMVACIRVVSATDDIQTVEHHGDLYALQECTAIRPLGQLSDKYVSWARTVLDCSEGE